MRGTAHPRFSWKEGRFLKIHHLRGFFFFFLLNHCQQWGGVGKRGNSGDPSPERIFPLFSQGSLKDTFCTLEACCFSNKVKLETTKAMSRCVTSGSLFHLGSYAGVKKLGPPPTTGGVDRESWLVKGWAFEPEADGNFLYQVGESLDFLGRIW